MPQVSVIVPIYNVAEYLTQCINSIIEQTFKDIELILVNDGSTDNSGNLCDNYKASHSNIVVIHKENGGLSDARNVGTKIATGDYIFYVDGDDWLVPNAIEELYTFAVANNCDIVQGAFYYAYPSHLLYDGRYFKENVSHFSMSREKAMLELIKNNFVKNFAWGKLYKSELVKRFEFPVGKYFEDSYWQHHIVHQSSCYGVVTKPIYYYRQRESSISGKISTRNIDLLKGYECRAQFINKHYPSLLPEITALHRNLSIQFAELAYASGDTDLIKAYAEYLNHNGITYNRLIYKLNNLAQRISSRLFAKPLTKVDYDIL